MKRISRTTAAASALLVLAPLFLLCPIQAAGDEATPQKKLIEALEKFNAVRKQLSKPSSAEALAAYKEALDVLRQVPGMLEKGKRYTFNLRGQENLPGSMPRELDLRAVLYNTQASYAPWGVELTCWLIDQGLFSSGFDLRVLRPYGKLLWIDIPLLKAPGPNLVDCRLYGPWKAALEKTQQNFDAATVKHNVYIRIFSPRIMDDNAWDLLGKTARGTELSLRWGSVFYGIATVSSGGAAGVLVPLGFALLDTGLDYLSDGPDSICVDLGHASTISNYTYTTVTAGKEAMALYRTGKPVVSLNNTGTVGMGIGLLDFAAKAVQHLCAREDYTAMVRALADENPPGYPEGFLFTGGTNAEPFPPILVHTTTLGRVTRGGRYPVTPGLMHVQTDADYPVWELLSSTYQADYRALYPKGARKDAALPADRKQAERIFSKVEKRGLPALRLRYAPRELFVSVPLSRIDVQAACHKNDIPLSKWSTIPLEELGLTFTITPSNGRGTPITLPVASAAKPAGREERYAVFRLVAFGHEHATAKIIDKLVPDAYRLTSDQDSYDRVLGPPLWRLDIERPVPLKGTIEIGSIPQPAHFRLDAGNRKKTRRVTGESGKGTPVSWDLTEAVRIHQEQGELEVVSPKPGRPPKVDVFVPFRIKCKKLPPGWQKIAADIDGNRVYYWWARSEIEKEVVWDFRFIPIGPGEHTITFYLPDHPDIAPADITIENVLTEEGRKRQQKKLKDAIKERDHYRSAGGSRARQLLNLLDEMEAEEDMGNAFAYLGQIDQLKASFARYEKLFRRFKSSYRPLPEGQERPDDLSDDEKELHRRAKHFSWIDVYTGRAALSLLDGDKGKTLKALRDIGEAVDQEFQEGTATRYDGEIYIVLGLLATASSGERSAGRAYALRGVDVQPADKRAKFKKRLLESPGGWILDEE